MKRTLVWAAALALTACLPEVRVGAKEGLPPIRGSTSVSTEAFVCGEPIGTATTRKVTGGCELSFVEDVQVLDEPDYAQISDLTGFSGLIEAVELQLTHFALVDTDAGAPLDTATRISAATVSVNGQALADKATLVALPQTLRLTGPELQPLKDAVFQRQPASLRVGAVVVLPDEPPLPKGLRLEYEAQPTIVMGGKL